MHDGAEAKAEILDVAYLEEVTGGDPALIRELAELYVGDADGTLPALLAAAAAGDLECFGRLAHGLKGSSAAIGASAAAAAFRRLEFMGRTGAVEGLAEALEQARQAYERTKKRLRHVAA
jgi:HPt (histidine-containing phosphotransfer) domain-containing protein